MTDPCNRGAQSTLPRPQLTAIPDELGEYIAWYALLVRDLGWGGISKIEESSRRISDLVGMDQPAHHLLSIDENYRVIILILKKYCNYLSVWRIMQYSCYPQFLQLFYLHIHYGI